MIKRIILEILFLLSIIILPVWVTALLGILLLFYFESFYEIVIFAFIMDIYYSHISSYLHFQDYKITILALVMVGISSYLKRFLKFYSK